MSYRVRAAIFGCCLAASVATARAAGSFTADSPHSLNSGPYNVIALEGGVGMQRDLAADAAMASAGSPWSLTA